GRYSGLTGTGHKRFLAWSILAHFRFDGPRIYRLSGRCVVRDCDSGGRKYRGTRWESNTSDHLNHQSEQVPDFRPDEICPLEMRQRWRLARASIRVLPVIRSNELGSV